MEFTREEIRRHIDEYARLTAQEAEIGKRIDDERFFSLSWPNAICTTARLKAHGITVTLRG